MKVRVPRSTYLAVINAKQAVLVDQPVQPHEAKKVIDAVEILVGMIRARATFIGAWNQLVQEMIEVDEENPDATGVIDLLPEKWRDRMMELLEQGLPLAIENSGFTEGHW